MTKTWSTSDKRFERPKVNSKRMTHTHGHHTSDSRAQLVKYAQTSIVHGHLWLEQEEEEEEKKKRECGKQQKPPFFVLLVLWPPKGPNHYKIKHDLAYSTHFIHEGPKVWAEGFSAAFVIRFPGIREWRVQFSLDERGVKLPNLLKTHKWRKHFL